MTRKLNEFIKRNRNRNAHLYVDGLIEGHDYIVCPVSKERMSMIKSSYIERILGLTVEEYDILYPGVRGVSTARKQNIKKGLSSVDPESGLTKYEISQIKAREVLRSVDSSGKTGYKRKGEKTRATHMSKIDHMGRNGYRRQADYRLTTVLDSGLTIEQTAHIKQRETLLATCKTGSGGASKTSKKVLKPILEYLDVNNIEYYFDKNEYCIKDSITGNYYFYDLTLPAFNLVIEYQSNAWHADPLLSEDRWRSWTPPRGKNKTANEVLHYDYNKARALFRARGFLTYFVWENSKENDVQDILCLLKTQNMKS